MFQVTRVLHQQCFFSTGQLTPPLSLKLHRAHTGPFGIMHVGQLQRFNFKRSHDRPVRRRREGGGGGGVVHVTPRNAQGTVSGTLVVVSLVVVSLVVVSFGAQHGLGGGVGSARGGGDGQRRFTPRTGHEKEECCQEERKMLPGEECCQEKKILLSGKIMLSRNVDVGGKKE